MSDKFITDTAGVFEIGQTVLAKVTNLDQEKRRFLISLKVSEVSWAESDAQARLIQGQRERLTVYDTITTRGKSKITNTTINNVIGSMYLKYVPLSSGDSDVLEQLSSVSLGDKLKMTVDVTREDGSVTLTSDQLRDATVLASQHHVTGQSIKILHLHTSLVI